MIPLLDLRGHPALRGSFGLTAAPLLPIIEPSDTCEVIKMRAKKILLFALGVFAAVAAFLSIRKLKK
jgi:hypothetical protein